MQTCCVDFESLPWTTPMPGVRVKAYRQGDRQLQLVEFAAGFVEPGWCAKGHIGYVLAGTAELELAGETVAFRAGDGVFIPAGGGRQAQTESRWKAVPCRAGGRRAGVNGQENLPHMKGVWCHYCGQEPDRFGNAENPRRS